MAGSSANFNEDELNDLEPVLDDDSFSMDLNDDFSFADEELIDPGMEPPDLDDISLDSMVTSAGDEYSDTPPAVGSDASDTSFELDIDSDLNFSEPETSETQTTDSIIDVDSEDSTEGGIGQNESDDMAFDESEFDLNLDEDLDLDLEMDDPTIDRKINEIVNEDRSNEAEPVIVEESFFTPSKEDSPKKTELEAGEFGLDDLDEDEPITLSLDELENITAGLPETEEEDHSFSAGADTADIDPDSEGFTDDELDQILGTDILQEEAETPALGDLGDDLVDDMADEPIALSLDELENIMASEEDDVESESETTIESGPNDEPESVTDPDIGADTELNFGSDLDFGNDFETGSDKKFDSEISADSDEDDFGLDLDVHTPPAVSLNDELNFDDFSELDKEFASVDTLDLPSNDVEAKEDESNELEENRESPIGEETVFGDDDIADEPITLSMDELSNITAFDDTPPNDIFSDDMPVKEELALGEDDDEPITLSMDELSAITEEAGESPELEFGDFPSLDEESDEAEFGADLPPLDRSATGLGHDDFSSLPEPDGSVEVEEFTLEEGDLPDTEEMPDAEELDDYGILHESDPDIESGDLSIGLNEAVGSIGDESEDESENLTLSDEELGNILGADLTVPIPPEEDADILFHQDDEIALLPETEEDEAITLTTDELTSIIGDLPPGEDLDEMDQVIQEQAEEEFWDPQEEPILEAMQTEEESDAGFDEIVAPKAPSLGIQDDMDDSTSVIDLDEYADEGGLSPKEQLRSLPSEANVPSPLPSPTANEGDSELSGKADAKVQGSGSELSPEDKKKVLTYLDNLLGNLPDDLIREFSKSNYFDLYKKMMKEIGL